MTLDERVEQTRRGENPTLICRMPSGWAVLGDTQFLHGYSLLLPDPVVADLNVLDTPGRTRFLLDMALIGDALLAVTGAARINYSIFGNSDAALHAHVTPRYASEPERLRRGPPAFYDRENAPQFDPERDAELMAQLKEAIEKRLLE